MKFHIVIRDYETVPRWYYGYGYRDWPRGVTHFYIVPLNWMVWLGKSISARWDTLRFGRSWFDRALQEARNKGYDEACNDIESKRRNDLQDSIIKELRSRYKNG